MSQPIPIPESKAQNPQSWLSYAIVMIAVLIAGWFGNSYLRGDNTPTVTPTPVSVGAIAANTPAAPVDTDTPTAVATNATITPILPATAVFATSTPIPPTATPTLLAGMPRNATAGQLWTEPTSEIDFVHVTAAEFLMGSTPQQVKDAGELCKKYSPNCDVDFFTNELPQTTINTAAYWIGKTEITNAQFKRFIDDKGYSTDAYWKTDGKTDPGLNWRKDNNVTQPNCWENKDFNSVSQPVVCVSWYEALAYTKWLSQQTGLTARLPSEAEWEKAARGTEGLLYPWGNDFDGSRLNYCDSNCPYNWKDKTVNDGYANTAAVGSFPSGASRLYGALDMAGNVWEWNSTLWGKEPNKPDFNYPYDANDGREDVSVGNDVYRQLRGGSWYWAPEHARVARRNSSMTTDRSLDIGFRVVVSVSPDN